MNEAEEFEAHRPRLMALAYRMTGSVADAEDIVQEAFVRWRRGDRTTVANPKAYLSRTVARLALDLMKSAKARRESYVGPWLPEPVLGEGAMTVEAATELAQDVSIALLLALERLSPLERAAFLLHDVFDAPYVEIAASLERSEEACRQLVSRARARVRDSKPRYAASDEEHAELVRAFGAAVLSGDTSGLHRVLSDDAVLYPDGGGKVVSALRPIYGADRIARFLVGASRKFPLSPRARLFERTVNGGLGFVIEEGGRAIQTIAFEVRAGRIAAVYVVRNPDKLARVPTS